METTFGECTDNEKKETVISDCSEMRTEGTSRLHLRHVPVCLLPTRIQKKSPPAIWCRLLSSLL